MLLPFRAGLKSPGGRDEPRAAAEEEDGKTGALAPCIEPEGLGEREVGRVDKGLARHEHGPRPAEGRPFLDRSAELVRSLDMATGRR